MQFGMSYLKEKTFIFSFLKQANSKQKFCNLEYASFSNQGLFSSVIRLLQMPLKMPEAAAK